MQPSEFINVLCCALVVRSSSNARCNGLWMDPEEDTSLLGSDGGGPFLHETPLKHWMDGHDKGTDLKVRNIIVNDNFNLLRQMSNRFSLIVVIV